MNVEIGTEAAQFPNKESCGYLYIIIYTNNSYMYLSQN
jgi:hypothetical protein